MEIKGLDYNTQRKPLLMAEYGREIQKMIDHAVSIADKDERQVCAETIIMHMSTKVPQLLDNEDYEQTLWDHLYIMSGKQLDIEWPFDVSNAERIQNKPAPMPLPNRDGTLQMRHYGRLVESLLNKLKDMPDGDERDELVRITANQMKRDLINWGHGSIEDERIINDLARFTDGKIQVDPATFHINVVGSGNMADNRKAKKRR